MGRMLQMEQELASAVDRLFGGIGDKECLSLLDQTMRQFRARVYAREINQRFGVGSARDLHVEIDEFTHKDDAEGEPLHWWRVCLSSVIYNELDLRRDDSLFLQAADGLDAWAGRISETAAELRELEETRRREVEANRLLVLAEARS